MSEYTSTTIAEIQNAVASGMQQLEHTIGNVRFIGDVTISKVQNWGIVFDASCAGDKLKCVWFERNAQMKAKLKDHTVYVICGKSQYTPYGMQIKVHSVVEDTETVSHTEQLMRLCNEKGWFTNKKEVDFLQYKRLGILSKKGSKGYEDFITQLRMPCDSVLVEISLEGAKTEPDIISGIAELVKRRVDCIMIIRGGGDFLDMSNSYDKATVFQAIVDCKVPVISAIGHSNDDLIINRVCDFHTETPTTLACFIRGQWRDSIQQAYVAQRQHITARLTDSYGLARRQISELIQSRRDAARVRFEHQKSAIIAAICPHPIYDMSYIIGDAAKAGSDYEIVVKLKDGTYHKACIHISSDLVDTGDVDLDSVHEASVDDFDTRVEHPLLAATQDAYRELHGQNRQWSDRQFGDVGITSEHPTDELSGLANQVALLEHYKLQLDNTNVQQCTLDILDDIAVKSSFTEQPTDMPEMMSRVRQLRYLMQTYGD